MLQLYICKMGLVIVPNSQHHDNEIIHINHLAQCSMDSTEAGPPGMFMVAAIAVFLGRGPRHCKTHSPVQYDRCAGHTAAGDIRTALQWTSEGSQKCPFQNIWVVRGVFSLRPVFKK